MRKNKGFQQKINAIFKNMTLLTKCNYKSENDSYNAEMHKHENAPKNK